MALPTNPKNKQLRGGITWPEVQMDPSIGQQIEDIPLYGLQHAQDRRDFGTDLAEAINAAPPQPGDQVDLNTPQGQQQAMELVDPESAKPEQGSEEEVAGWAAKADALENPTPSTDPIDVAYDEAMGEPAEGGIGLMSTLGIINMGAGLGSQIYKMATRKKPRRPVRSVPGSSGNPFK